MNEPAKDSPVIPRGKAMWTLLILMLGSNLLASLNQSLMNVALDRVATDFHVRLSLANWMVLGFSIVAATAITTAASLLKRFGARKIMFFGYFASLAGSLLGVLSWDFGSMFAARLIQALTVGIFFPVVTSVILTISPADKKGTLLAINSGVIGVGMAFSPMLSGLMLTRFGLHSLFIIPLALSIVLMIPGFFLLHDLAPHQPVHFDIPSIVLSFIGLGAVMLGLNEVTRSPLPASIAILVGIMVIVLFAARQHRLSVPLLNLMPFTHARFTIGEVLMMLGYMASIYMSLLFPLYLEGAAGYTAFLTGAVLIVPALCYAMACFFSGRIEDDHGIWPLIPIGFATILIGFLIMHTASAGMKIAPMLVCAAVAYIGVGLVFPTLKSFDLRSLPTDIYAHGASIHSTLVQIAQSIASALFVGIMSADTDRLRELGQTKAHAYEAGFSHTLRIIIMITIAALVASTVFAVKNSGKHHAQ